MTVAYESAGAGTVDADNDVVVTKPSGTTAGDLLLAHIDPWINSGSMAGETITPPDGTWTMSGAGYLLYGNNLARDAVFWKIAGSAEPSTYTFTSSRSCDGIEGTMLRISGAHQTSPLAAAPAGAQGTGTTNPNPPASGSVHLGDYLAVVFASTAQATAGTHTPPTNYDERVDNQFMSAATRSLTGITSEDPGTFGPATFHWGAFTFLIRSTAPIYESVSSGTSLTTPLTITKPSGTASGDLLLAVITAQAEQSWSSTGWTPVNIDATNDVDAAYLWKIAGGSEPADYSFAGGVGEEDFAGGILRISGAHQTVPILVSQLAEGTTSVDGAATGTVASGDYLAVLLVGAGDNVDITFPAGYTERFDLGLETSADVQAAAATRYLTSITSENPGNVTVAADAIVWTLLIQPGVATETPESVIAGYAAFPKHILRSGR